MGDLKRSGSQPLKFAKMEIRREFSQARGLAGKGSVSLEPTLCVFPSSLTRLQASNITYCPSPLVSKVGIYIKTQSAPACFVLEQAVLVKSVLRFQNEGCLPKGR